MQKEKKVTRIEKVIDRMIPNNAHLTIVFGPFCRSEIGKEAILRFFCILN